VLERIKLKLASVQKQEAQSKLISQASSTHVSSATPYSGNEIYKEMARIIKLAEQEICMMFYKFDSKSEPGQEIIKALTDLQKKATKNKQHITVKFLINRRGPISEFFYRWNNNTGLAELATLLNNPYFTIHVGSYTTNSFDSLHSKVMTVDKKSAMFFSGDPYPSCDENKNRFEVATLITGEACQYAYQNFLKLWHLSYPKKNSDNHDEKLENQIKKEYFYKTIHTPCLFISKQGNPNPLSSSDIQSPYKIALIEAINNATHSIKIMTPNLNDMDICKAIADACKRKVSVQIALGKYHNHSIEKHWGGSNIETMAKLIDLLGSSELEYLNIKWATTGKGNLVKHGDHDVLHGKFACIDEKIVFIGSTPLDKQGLQYSHEADLIFEDTVKAAEFTNKMFTEKWMVAKDYYTEICQSIVKITEEHIKRLRSAQLSQYSSEKMFKQRAKGVALKNTLQVALDRINDPDVPNHNKPILLLKMLLPILKKHTGREVGKTRSYNEIVDFALKFGFDKLDSIQEDTPSLSAALKT
jgi:phosphatidylserine/phosphatidylglycerophosphate/cardiolipin synthase-like enzyme